MLRPGVSYLSTHRRRKLQKACYDARITVAGTIMTFLFLKSCFDGGRLTFTLIPSQENLQTSRRQLFDRRPTTLLLHENHAGELAGIASDPGSFGHLDFNTTLQAGEGFSNTMNRTQYNTSIPNPIRASGKNSLYTSGKTHPSFLLLTAYTTIASSCQSHLGKYFYQEFITRSILNKMKYCSLHGIDMISYGHMMPAHDQVPSQTSLYRLSLLHKLMRSQLDKQNWIWWVNSDDVLITNMSMKMPIDTQDYDGYNLILYGNGVKKSLNNAELIESMIRSSFLIRSCEWSLDFLSQLAIKGQTNKSIHNASESVLIEDNEWRNQIHLENFLDHRIYYAWDVMESIQDAPAAEIKWPLMSHFVRCSMTNSCNGHKDSLRQQELCKSATQKALNLYHGHAELRPHE